MRTEPDDEQYLSTVPVPEPYLMLSVRGKVIFVEKGQPDIGIVVKTDPRIAVCATYRR